VSDQQVNLNSVQQALCDKFHLGVEAHGDGFIVTDRDPILKAKKKGYPKHRGTDLNALIFQAKAEQEARNGSNVVELVTPEAPVVPEVPVAPKVVPLRRAVFTEADVAPATLTDVVLDESNKKVRKPKAPEKKHRDNRYARALRALLENPDASPAQQAKIADVTEDMFRWYHITFRHVDRLYREMYGNECIPPLPELND
jgi:hypothetical protein